MTEYTGGCACGAVRYSIEGVPILQNHCQCRDCQHRSGTGHGSYLTFDTLDALKVSGDRNAWRVAGDSGNGKIHAFCPTCGTPVYLTFEVAPDIVAIHAGSLDDPGQFVPSVVTYAIRAHGWDFHDPTLARFDQMPG